MNSALTLSSLGPAYDQRQTVRATSGLSSGRHRSPQALGFGTVLRLSTEMGNLLPARRLAPRCYNCKAAPHGFHRHWAEADVRIRGSGMR